MSIYRCDGHGSRIDGSLETAYPSLHRGAFSYSRKVRLCPECMDQLLGSESIGLTSIRREDEEFELLVCSACRQNALDESALDPCFVTVYRRNSDRADYFARLCGPCGDGFVERYRLALQ